MCKVLYRLNFILKLCNTDCCTLPDIDPLLHIFSIFNRAKKKQTKKRNDCLISNGTTVATSTVRKQLHTITQKIYIKKYIFFHR